MSFRRSGVLLAADIIALAIAAIAMPANAQADSPAVTINGAVTVVVSGREPAAIQRAAEDLRKDFTRVFGQAPHTATTLETAGPMSLLIAERANLPQPVSCATTTDTEAFAFSIAILAAPKRQVLCLVGADMRGTIFAIYEFSQHILGVDPMYLWTDKQPRKRSAIPLPADFEHVFRSPVFRYRGLFINDEDLLSGWIPAAPGEHTGISLKVWDNIFETTLRLKGNMIVPGTWIFPDDAQVQAEAKRGLIVNQHHAIPLGVNVARWPRDVPYNFSTHPEILERAWTNAVAEYRPDEEILWSVGLRGLSDASYASLDPSVRDNDPLLGKRVSDAIADQMKIVRARYPDARFVTDLWQEGARLMKEGYLKIPPEVTLVWADTGYGDMQDGGDVAAGQGAYFHVAMMNGNANQLSEMVPVSVIDEELGRYIRAGANAYFLVNTSDIRPVAMTTRRVMDVAWGGVPQTPRADGAFYRQWATEEFGAKSATALEKVYEEYFAAPAPRTPYRVPGLTSAGNAPPSQQTYSTVPREEGDQHYHSEVRRLILDTLTEHQVIAIPSQSPKWTQPRVLPSSDAEMRKAELQHDIDECAGAQPRWDAVSRDAAAAESLVASERRNYYQAGVLTMITINRESNRTLLEVARSLQDYEAGNSVKAKAEASKALQALDTIQKAMAAAEYGKWKNWYRGDWLTGVYRTRELVQNYASHLADPMAKLPAPAAWSGWEAYFHIMEYEDDRSVDVQPASANER
jgi:hypothetical protein